MGKSTDKISDRTIEALLRALDDERLQKRIAEIAASNLGHRDESNINLKQKGEHILELENENRNLNATIEQLKIDIDFYKSIYGKADNLFNMYKSLSENISIDLANILDSDNQIAFLVKGVQWENLKGLEDYILANLDMEEKDFSVLCKVFDGLFELYAIADKNCVRLNTKPGEEFDLDYHTRGAGSRGVDGKIEKVLFDGYKKGNMLRKSVVWIEG